MNLTKYKNFTTRHYSKPVTKLLLLYNNEYNDEYYTYNTTTVIAYDKDGKELYPKDSLKCYQAAMDLDPLCKQGDDQYEEDEDNVNYDDYETVYNYSVVDLEKKEVIHNFSKD